MTVLVDAYAVIAYLRDEPASDQVADLLRGQTLLAAVNAAEIMDQMVRVWHQDPDDVQVALALLVRSGMTIPDAGEVTALEAGRLRARHYDKRSCCVSMADCFAAATALAAGVPLATSDPDLVALVLAENGKALPLPDGRGHVPKV
ncbi:MAG: PIN domain-containing protein [Candidatus Nanopelagicales bacterium]|nr:PIN domain-containing protein [Candidatus Nanopelagicales bacterium]